MDRDSELVLWRKAVQPFKPLDFKKVKDDAALKAQMELDAQKQARVALHNNRLLAAHCVQYSRCPSSSNWLLCGMASGVLRLLCVSATLVEHETKK